MNLNEFHAAAYQKKSSKPVDQRLENATDFLKEGGLLKVSVDKPEADGKDSVYRRVAKFLLLIGEDEAAKILPHLSETQIEKIIPEIASIRSVDKDEAAVILEEFNGLLNKAREEGGIETAREMLEKAYGKKRADQMLKKAIPLEGKIPFDYLKDADSERVYLLLKDENVGVQSLVLSYLEPKKAASIINMMKNDEKKVEYLNPNEISLLREEMKEESFNVLRDRLMFELLYSSGMTVAELLSLGELNFNLEKREIYLLKNRISKVLYFSQTCKEVYLKFLIAKKEKFKEDNNTNIIFVNNSNMRLTDRSVRRLINKYSERANLQKEVSPYTLRHSFCIYMLKNGMPKEYLAKLLDLKSIGLLDIYEDLCKKEIL